jgi:NADPH:quinone reductase-like Zn-dependent oxidoreductase
MPIPALDTRCAARLVPTRRGERLPPRGARTGVALAVLVLAGCAPRAGLDAPPTAGSVAARAAAPLVARDADRPAMTAMRIAAFGPPEALRPTVVPRPTPAAGELLVRVRAARVNPVDTQVRSGAARDLVGATLPYVPGFDVSGVVEEVGPGITGFRPGDEVFAMLDLRRGGGYAEYAIVKEGEAAARPAGATHLEAASLPLVALTAWQALFETAELAPGQTVLIHAGAGGVGSIAIQLAKWRGARVIATASEANHGFLRELGADVVVDYRTQRFEDVARDVDVVLDPVGGDTQLRSLGVLRSGGILVALLGLEPEERAPGRNARATAILVEPSADQLRSIAGLVEQGVVRPIVSHVFPLDAAPEAHVQSETGRTRGKIVLQLPS